MSRFAHIIFCDDVRHEVNGKVSLIGTFQNQLFVAAFPTVLPKLCILATVTTSVDNLFKNLQLKATYNENVIAEFNLSESDLVQASNNVLSTGDHKFFSINGEFILSPLAIDKPGKLVVSVVADGEEINCPALSIEAAPEGAILR